MTLAGLEHGQLIGTVAQLTLRPERGAAPCVVSQVTALGGLGLAGDRHADALSPRQLLLAGTDVYARHALAPHALRENLLLAAAVAQLPSGAVLRIGASAMLRVMFLCEPCGRLNAQRPGLATAIGAQRGMLARVLRGGVIDAGDPVRLLAPRLPAWPVDWRDRLAYVLSLMPPGMVIDYRQLAWIAGLPAGYCRAFPRALQKMGLAEQAVPARSLAPQPRWLGAQLFTSETEMIL